jgi:hypothetical protein
MRKQRGRPARPATFSGPSRGFCRCWRLTGHARHIQWLRSRDTPHPCWVSALPPAFCCETEPWDWPRRGTDDSACFLSAVLAPRLSCQSPGCCFLRASRRCRLGPQTPNRDINERDSDVLRSRSKAMRVTYFGTGCEACIEFAASHSSPIATPSAVLCHPAGTTVPSALQDHVPQRSKVQGPVTL